MSTETKTKLKKVGLFSYLGITTLLSILFIVLCVVAGVNNGKTNRSNKNVATSKNEVVEVQHRNKVQPRYASYDDSNYTITLSVEEITTYTWNNLKDYVMNNFTSYTSIGSLSEDSEISNASFYWSSSTENGVFLNASPRSGRYLYFNHNNDGLWSKSGFTNNSFTQSVVIVFNSSYYEGFKNAIDLDIQANNPIEPITTNIFETLTSSVVSFIGSLSSGIVAITSVFYSNDSLTVIGLLSVIVVAVSLAYFLFRLLIGLIRMRG